MKGVEDQLLAVSLEEGDKEKKRRRRPNRRPKQNVPPLSASSCSLPDEKCSPMNWSEKHNSAENTSNLAEACPVKSGLSNGAFSSMPSMPITVEEYSMGGPSPPALERKSLHINSRSCPDPIYCHGKRNDSSSSKEIEMVHANYFASHWSADAVNEAIEKGDAFRATFRVNAYNRLEAYCTLDGVPIDILISGAASQNRAVEGDIVVVKVNPVTSWLRLKDSARCSGNCNTIDDLNRVSEVVEVVHDNSKGKKKVETDSECHLGTNGLLCGQNGYSGGLCSDFKSKPGQHKNMLNGDHATASYCSKGSMLIEQDGPASALEKICSLISLHPSKRPTGWVLAILKKSPRRDAIVGFLSVKQFYSFKDGSKQDIAEHPGKNISPMSFSERDYIHLNSTDPRFPKMIVPVRCLPEFIEERLKKNDETLEMEIIAARIDEWREDNLLPQGQILHVLGQSGEIEPQIAAIIFENMIYNAKFSTESLACLPSVPWEIPVNELQRRTDLRCVCTFTIDPPAAIELDDALSVEIVSDGIYRVGVHIADVSYFVQPDTALDTEAQKRSTSVYLVRHKLSMLPPQLSEGMGSLSPGVDRITMSIMWDIDLEGKVLNQWIGRTIIRSCCKLSYAQAQAIIDGSLDFEADTFLDKGPKLYGPFEWCDVFKSVKDLHQISKKLKESRFKSGALWLESSKTVFLFDECGVPYHSKLCEMTDANFLVEEFTLLANQTAAKVISRAFPHSALLRRHPEPNFRKLKEFVAFCGKHGFELDASSSSQLQLSLWKIKEKLKSDTMLFDILISFATRPMQLATYFCSGDLKEREHEWAHYALAIPCYTHFTSPLRRYPDIIVHRMLAAIIDAEKNYFQIRGHSKIGDKTPCEVMNKCFTGLSFDGKAAESVEGKEALSAEALKHKVPGSSLLTNIAAYCNERKLASRHAEEAGEKLYLWALLKKKEAIIADGRVLSLGPKFMSVYIHKFGMERRIYYDDVEGLLVDWLETTNSLVLDFFVSKHFQRKGIPGKFRPLEDVALVVNPSSLNWDQLVLNDTDHEYKTESEGGPFKDKRNDVQQSVLPAVFPLTLQLLSYVPVVLLPYGGKGSPIEIGARLYMCSYFSGKL